jgi:ABC-type methionine transport system permease subunit
MNDTKNPFNQPDTVSIYVRLGELLLCILLGPIIVLVAILIPLFASHIQTTKEMEAGIVALVLFTLTFAALCFYVRRQW